MASPLAIRLARWLRILAARLDPLSVPPKQVLVSKPSLTYTRTLKRNS